MKSKQKTKQEEADAKEDYEAALNAKVRIEELEKKIANHTEDHKVTATINDAAESVERMTVFQFHKWCKLISNV